MSGEVSPTLNPAGFQYLVSATKHPTRIATTSCLDLMSIISDVADLSVDKSGTQNSLTVLELNVMSNLPPLHLKNLPPLQLKQPLCIVFTG